MIARILVVMLLVSAWPTYICQKVHAQKFNDSVEELLLSQPKRFGHVTNDPAKFRVQVIYTQIDRDSNNQPNFKSFLYRLDADEYFYPASTVKLPVALLALEKLNQLSISGLDRNATMVTGKSHESQTPADKDDTSTNGLPSVGNYVRKILLVSDNDAFNRLFELVGPGEINRSLRRKNYRGCRIVHRLSLALSPSANLMMNPISFMSGEKQIYHLPARNSRLELRPQDPVFLGTGEWVGGKLVNRPKEFTHKNRLPLKQLHDIVKNIVFPSSAGNSKFHLSDDDQRFVIRCMSQYPGESGIERYSDAEKYPQGYVKFLMFGGTAKSIPANIRIFNKVGSAYGFLTDAAYIVDFENRVEFLLAATIYTNQNGIFNDNQYEYDQIGLPFLRDLGMAIYELELKRKKQFLPDLSDFERLGKKLN